MLHTINKVSIEFSKTPIDVFNHVIDLANWWPEEFVGDKLKLNSEFVLKTGDGHYSKNSVVEFMPGSKLEWVVTESKRAQDNFDWTGTKMIFELRQRGNNTLLTFIYDGPVLEDEQERLSEICDFCIRKKLFDFINS